MSRFLHSAMYLYQTFNLPSPKNDMFNRYKPDHSEENSPTENRRTKSPQSQSRYPQESQKMSKEIADNHSKELESLPEQYDTRNIKNFTEYYQERKTRPFCPFLLKGRCPSTRCLYYHPLIITYDDYSHETNLYSDPILEDPQFKASNPKAPEDAKSSCYIHLPNPPRVDNTRNHYTRPQNQPEVRPYHHHSYQPEERTQYRIRTSYQPEPLAYLSNQSQPQH